MGKSIRSKIKRKWRTKRVNDTAPERAATINENYVKYMEEIKEKKRLQEIEKKNKLKDEMNTDKQDEEQAILARKHERRLAIKKTRKRSRSKHLGAVNAREKNNINRRNKRRRR